MTVIDLDDECDCWDNCACYDIEPPFDWDEFGYQVRTDIATAKASLSTALRVSCSPQLPNKARPAMWWQLMTPPPLGLSVRDEYEPLETFSYRSHYPITAPVSTIWLELPPSVLEYRFGYSRLDQPDPKRWLIKGYQIKRDDDSSAVYLDAVLAYEPPDFGWWMPLLKESW